MKPQYCTTLLFITFLILLFHGCMLFSDSTFDGGSGTEANPYQISTIEQLQAIDDPEYLDKHFIQVADIDASASAEFQNGSGFKFIGDQERPFTGSYNGNGYVIRNLHLHIQRSGTEAGLILHTGLFGYVKNGRIEDVTIDNSSDLSNKSNMDQFTFGDEMDLPNNNFDNLQYLTTADTRGIGFLVGYNNGGEIKRCRVVGVLSGHPISHTVGGLVGVNRGLIDSSSFEGVAAGSGTAGLVAFNWGSIRNSISKARVEGMSGYGLVVVNYGEITDSYFEGEISSTFRSVGVVGTNYNNAIISGTYSTGEARSAYNVAGFAGINHGNILNSYSNMDLKIYFLEHSSDIHVGGIALDNTNTGKIQYSFYSGHLSLSGEEDIYGGISTVNEGTLQATYWDTETTGQNEGVGEGNPDGTTGLTTAQMTGPAAETHMPEFDWQTVWRTTDSYPVLRWQEDE